MPAGFWPPGLKGTTGGAIGPDRALCVAEGALGRVTLIDQSNGKATTFASGLPPAIAPIGGAIDLVFVGSTAYVLVTLVGSDVGGSSVDGIYRIDGPTSFTVVADIGAFALAHPPVAEIFLVRLRWSDGVASCR